MIYIPAHRPSIWHNGQRYDWDEYRQAYLGRTWCMQYATANGVTTDSQMKASGGQNSRSNSLGHENAYRAIGYFGRVNGGTVTNTDFELWSRNGGSETLEDSINIAGTGDANAVHSDQWDIALEAGVSCFAKVDPTPGSNTLNYACFVVYFAEEYTL